VHTINVSVNFSLHYFTWVRDEFPVQLFEMEV
jgi:hypothetical protein